MSRDPGSVWAGLPEAGAPDGYTKIQFIVHSTGTGATAAANRAYFAKPEVVVESTFIVGKSAADPTLQVMDSTDNADSNVKANQRAIAVETVGTGDEPFTDWQLSELIRLGRWAADNHPIARRIIPSEPESGFGWHVMFGAPGPWTTVSGKVCPGAIRTQQLKDTVFPAIFEQPAPAAPPPPAPPAPAPAPVFDVRGWRVSYGQQDGRIPALRRWANRVFPGYKSTPMDEGATTNYGPQLKAFVREFGGRIGVPNDGADIGPRIAAGLYAQGFRG